MRKTFKQILQERRDLDLSSSAFDELIDLFQQIREATIKECVEKGYALEKLDKTSIKIYEI